MFMMCDLSESPGAGGSCQPQRPAQPSPCALHLAGLSRAGQLSSAGSCLGLAPSVTQKPSELCEKSTVTSTCALPPAMLLPCHLWRDSSPKGPTQRCKSAPAGTVLLLWPWQLPFRVTALSSQCGNPLGEFIFLVVGKS